MLDHIGFDVKSLPSARSFYERALAPLGISVLVEVSAEQSGDRAFVGMGAAGKPVLWFGEGDPHSSPSPIHIALTANSRDAVDQFHAAALAAGGTDNGAPGLREHYHPHYYGAFVLDPDGNNLEAVCHLPPLE